MAYIQRNNPPKNEVKTFSLRNFEGGLNNRAEVLMINECSDVMNMIFSNDTLMEKRMGSKRYLPDFLPAIPRMIDEYRPYTDADQFVYATDTQIKIGNDVFTTKGAPYAENYQGKYFFADGEELYVYGKFPQATTTYEKVTGTAVATPVLMKVRSTPKTYTALDTTHKRGVTVYDYTTKTIHYEPCQNERDDPYLGVSAVPANPRYIVQHKGRVYLSGDKADDDNVFISQVANPYYFPPALPMQLPPNSDKIRGMAVFDDGVVIGRTDDMYVIDGITNNPTLELDMFQLRKLNVHVGFANQRAVDIANDYMFYVGSDGNMYVLSTVHTDTKSVVSAIISKQIDVTKHPINATYAQIQGAVSYFLKDDWYVGIGNKVLVYNYRVKAWTVFNGLDVTCFSRKDDKLIWGNDRKQIMQFDPENYLDDGMPYEAYWYSSRMDMGDPSVYKQFREFYIVAHSFDTSKSEIRVSFEIDWMDVKDDFVVSQQLSRWGISQWGDKFSSRSIIVSYPIAIGQRGRMLRVMLRSGYKAPVYVDTPEQLWDIPKKYEDMLAYVRSEKKFYAFRITHWEYIEPMGFNQPLKVYQVNGDYELRGKR